MPSRTLLGPRIGRTKYGPKSTPHTASVWPKSSVCFGNPMSLATSIRPRRPKVEFHTNRPKSSIARSTFPCSSWFTATQGSLRLEKKLVTAVRAGQGRTNR